MTPAEVGSTEAGSELLGWLLAQSAALVVSMLWVASLLVDRRRTAQERQALQAELRTCHERNALLSDWLCRSVESACGERTKLTDRHVFQIDSMVRSWQGLLTQALDMALTSPESSPPRSKPET